MRTKCLLLTLFALLGVTQAMADVEINETNFPDVNFRNWILNNIEEANDGVLTDSELESITYIDCSEQQIQSLKGIEYFTSLDNLYCQFNPLTSLDVSKNTKLNSLICYQNQLTSLDVSHNILLKALVCSENQLTSLDVSKNTELSYLACGYNQLTSLDLSHNAALTSLTCTSNQLTSLDLSHNPLLEGELRCGRNQLTSLDLENFTKFALIECEYNQLSTLDVSKNTALEILNCGHNQLTSLDISHNTSLTVLYAGDNQLSTLDVSNNTSLIQLYVDFNQLTSIDISHNSALEEFSCWANQLTSLDLSKNTALTRLDCMVNSLTSLDLSKNTALTSLRCELNQLYNLDLSCNTLLSSYSENSPQYADITYDYINGLDVKFHYVSIRALDIPEGIAIPVPSTFNISKVSDLKLDETEVQGSIAIINGLKFLVLAHSGIDPSCQVLSYSYDTGNNTVGPMVVNVPVSYTGTATIWTDPETNHTWIYSSSDANASIDRNAWATGDIVVPSAINGYLVNDIDYKAFYGCSGMTSLTIPSTVTHMCDYVINGCTGLEKLIVMATTPPAISDVTFIDYDIPLYVPDEAVETYKNTATWKNFKTIRALFEKNIIVGDVNGDGVVNVTDIVATVNYIMEKPSDGFNKEAADLNGDGEINVTDIVKMVTIIMSGDGGSSRRAAATSGNLVISGHNIQLRNAENYIAAQFDINLSDGQSISDIVLNVSSNHDLHWKMIDASTCRVVVYSMTNTAFGVNGDNLFNIFINGGQRATISNELLIKAGNTTGIDAIRKESENGKVYDLNGRQVKTPRKGVYIINGKKMVVK